MFVINVEIIVMNLKFNTLPGDPDAPLNLGSNAHEFFKCSFSLVPILEVEVLGRIDSKPRWGGVGRHVSLTNSAVLSLVQ